MSLRARRVIAACVTAVVGFAATVSLAPSAFATHTVTSLAVPYINQGATRNVTIKGTGFASIPPPSVSVTPSTDITVGTVTFVNSTTITAIIGVGAGAALGPRDLTVTQTPSVDTATCTGCLLITNPAATTPGGLENSTSDGVFSLTDAGFSGGVTQVQLEAPGITSITATSTSVTASTLQAHVPIEGAAPTNYVVVVTPTSGPVLRFGDTAAGGFTVTSAQPPILTSANPSGLGQGVTKTVSLGGSNLAKSATVTTNNGGVTVGTVTWISRSRLDVVLSVAIGASPGPVDVTVTNTDTKFGVCTSCITINAHPTVSSVLPSLGQGASRPVTITGTGFSSALTPSDVAFSGSGVTVASLAWNSATQLTAVLNVAQSAATGARNVTVTNPDGGAGACSGCFTITAAPAVSGSTPTAASDTNSGFAITINGSGFDNTGNALTAALRHSGQADIPVTIGSTTTTSIAGTVDLTNAPTAPAAPGAWDIRVVNADGGIGTCVACFTITAPQASISSISPSTVGQGASAVTLTFTGAGFANGDTVTFGSGVSAAGPVNVVSGTSLSVPVTVDPGATVGPVSTRVDHPSVQTGTPCASCLAVNAAPTLNSTTPITPASRGQGSQNQTVTITGTGFQPGATVSFSGSGVTVSGTPAVSGGGTTITAVINVATNAATTARDLTVANPDGGAATAATAFTVTAGPTVSTILPTSRGQGAQAQTITITGTGFVAGATVSFSGTGVTVSGTPAVSGAGTTISAVINIAPGAATGARDLTVTNPDGGTAAKAAAFTVTPAVSISATTPANGIAGTTFGMAIDGSNFVSGTTVTFSNSGVSHTQMSVVSPTRIELTIAIQPGGAAGAGQITVSNPDGSSATAPFTVVAADQVQRFVTASYLLVLGRLPERGGFDYWEAQIRGGAPRPIIARALYGSLEVRRNIISFLYAIHLHRTPDEGGLQYYADQLRTRTIESIQIEFTASDEYFASRGGNNFDHLITAVYNDVLGRNPDSGGLAYWRSQLQAGQPRSVVAAAIIFSDEAINRIVDNSYLVVLGRAPDAAGRDYWRQQIQAGVRLEDFLSLLIGSDEFFSKV